MTKTLPTPIILLLLLIAGGLQPLTLAPFDLWFLGPLSIAMILWVTQSLTPRQQTSISPLKSFWFGWAFGFGLFGFGASWVYVSIHNFGHAPPALAAALTFCFTGGLAIVPGLTFWLFFKLRSESTLHNALLFLVIWVLGDEFRTEFLTGFPWLFLGYGHLNSPLSGWIPIVGVYGITLFTVATGIVLALLFSAVSKKVKISAFAFICTLWIVGTGLENITWSHPKIMAGSGDLSIAEENKSPILSVALIQSNIPQEKKWLRAQRVKTMFLLKELSQEHWHDDLIIWPETAVPMLYDLAQPYLHTMADQAVANHSNIISGIPFREVNKTTGEQTVHNSIVSIGSGSGIYHKQKLVPFGEYVPMQDYLRGLITFFDLPMSNFRKGEPNQALLKSFDFQIAPFICYEVVYPDFVASRAKEADFLLTISNDSWFGASLGPLQHLEMAQMRAAENSRYMIRSTNNGISAMINERGKIIAKTEQFVETTLESEVIAMTGRTPFSYTGSYPIFFLCGLYLLWSLRQRILHLRKTSQDGISLV